MFPAATPPDPSPDDEALTLSSSDIDAPAPSSTDAVEPISQTVYVSPTVQWLMTVVTTLVGIMSIVTGLVSLFFAPEQIPAAEPGISRISVEPARFVAVCATILSGICWLITGVKCNSGRIVASGWWLLFGIVTGLIATML